jgi:hypothetical protein
LSDGRAIFRAIFGECVRGPLLPRRAAAPAGRVTTESAEGAGGSSEAGSSVSGGSTRFAYQAYLTYLAGLRTYMVVAAEQREGWDVTKPTGAKVRGQTESRNHDGRRTGTLPRYPPMMFSWGKPPPKGEAQMADDLCTRSWSSPVAHPLSEGAFLPTQEGSGYTADVPLLPLGQLRPGRVLLHGTRALGPLISHRPALKVSKGSTVAWDRTLARPRHGRRGLWDRFDDSWLGGSSDSYGAFF